MKNVFIILVMVSLFSCSKEDDSATSGGTIGTGDLTMKVNGTPWSGKIIGNMIDETTDNLVVQSLSGTNESFGIVIEDFTGIGNYPTSQGANFTGSLYTRKDKVVFSGGGIKYKITEIMGTGTSKKAHGTFEGSLKSSAGEVLTVTEGKF
jgi:hypothetical protein